MENIKDIVKTVIGNIAKQRPDEHNKTQRIWENLATEKERKHAKLLGVREGTLFVCVDSPAWLHQMRIRQTNILKTLKEEIPEIKHIRFKMGKIQ